MKEAVIVLTPISAHYAAGQVRSPGGLLRRMVELHQTGGLRLDWTLFRSADGLDRDRHDANNKPSIQGHAP